MHGLGAWKLSDENVTRQVTNNNGEDSPFFFARNTLGIRQAFPQSASNSLPNSHPRSPFLYPGFKLSNEIG
jgi:hypothetical protein